MKFSTPVSLLSEICSCLSENCSLLPTNHFNPRRTVRVWQEVISLLPWEVIDLWTGLPSISACFLKFCSYWTPCFKFQWRSTLFDASLRPSRSMQMWQWLQIDTDVLLIITSTADSFPGVPTSMTFNDLEPPKYGFLVNFSLF